MARGSNRAALRESHGCPPPGRSSALEESFRRGLMGALRAKLRLDTDDLGFKCSYPRLEFGDGKIAQILTKRHCLGRVRAHLVPVHVATLSLESNVKPKVTRTHPCLNPRARASLHGERDISSEGHLMTTVPETMTAVIIAGKGGPDVLVPATLPVPQPGPGQLLVKVSAAGVNRPDVLQRKGLYPAPKGHSETPGLEISGTVVAAGSGAERFKVGDQVMALVNGGGYAEYCIADEPACLPIPAELSLTEAAGFPETFFTVWHNVFERGALKSGEWLLVHGGTSGIGVTAIQLAKARGAMVIATAGSEEKCAACRKLGADRAVDYTKEDFVEAVKAETGGRGVDVILDMVGGDYIDRNIKSAAEDGRIVNIGYQKGSQVSVDMMRVMLKRLILTGSTLRIRPTEVKGAIARALEEKVLPLLIEKRVRIVMDSTFPIAQVADAHRRMEEGSHIGKIVLTV